MSVLSCSTQPQEILVITYLSRPEVAAVIGVAPATMYRYKLPAPDAMIGKLPGWTQETIETWHAQRPGRGNWKTTDKAAQA